MKKSSFRVENDDFFCMVSECRRVTLSWGEKLSGLLGEENAIVFGENKRSQTSKKQPQVVFLTTIMF